MRRSALRVLLASIAVNAALGIWALLTDEFGDTESKILVTSLLVSAAMLSILVNAAAIQRRSLWPVPAVAAAAAVASFVLFTVLMWADVEHEVPLKLAASGLVVAAGATLAGLVSLLPMPPSQEVVRIVHNGMIAVLAATVLWGIWAEVDSSWYGRLVGVESVLVAALTLAVPVLSRFGGTDDQRDRPVTRPALTVSPHLSVADLVDRLLAAGASEAVVEGPEGRIGVVSEHDIVQAVGTRGTIEGMRVTDLLSLESVAGDVDGD